MSKRFILAYGFCALLVAVAPAVLTEGAMRLATECFLVLSMAQMWNLLAGYTGLVSFGHQVFVALGAYGLLVVSGWLGVSPYWILPVAPVVCAMVAAVIAVPLFRLREAYFSIAMWVFSEIIGAITMKSAWLGGNVRRALGYKQVDRFRLVRAGDVLDRQRAGARHGRRFLSAADIEFRPGLMSVRDKDLAAMSVGVDVRRNRFIVFVLSAAGCGFAGAVSFMGSLYIAPAAAFDVNWVVYMMFIVMIGGIGTLEGPIVGTVIFFGLREIVTGPLGLSAGWYLVALGLVAVVIMLWSPSGLWPVLRDRFEIRLLSVRRMSPKRIEKPL